MDPQQMTCADVEELAGLYVLDALEPEEMAAVSSHLQRCPEAHQVFADLASTSSELIASIEPQDAPAGMRDRVMAAVASTPQQPDIAGLDVAPGVVPDPALQGAANEGTPPTVPLTAPALPAAIAPNAGAVVEPPAESWLQRHLGRRTDRRSGWAWSGVAAGVLAIVLVAVGAVGFLQLTDDDPDRLALLRQAVAAAAGSNDNVAVLAGGDSAGAPFGYAVFPDDQAGFIVIDGLPAPGHDQAYQAWFLADGVPTSAGLLSLGDDGLATLTGLQPGAGTNVVAVTVEMVPGAEAPSGDPVLAGELAVATATTSVRLAL